MINLLRYYGKKVKIVSSSGQEYIGWVSDYFPLEENENGMESIALENPPIEFYGKDIASIEIID